MGLEAGERQGRAWVPFPVSPSSHPPVPLLFSAAPAVQSKTALGLWRRWHSKAEVSLLLQHSPMEQAGGLSRLSFLQEAGPWAASLALVTPGGTGRSAFWGSFTSRTASRRWGTRGFAALHVLLSPLLFMAISKEEAAGWARLSSPPGPPWWQKEPECPPPGSGGVPLLGASLPQLSTQPWNSLPVLFISAATTVTPPCFVTFCGFQMQPLWALGWSPSPGSLPVPDCMCTCGSSLAVGPSALLSLTL